MIMHWYSWFSIYALIGGVFTASLDHILARSNDEEIEFTNIERILCIVLWPIYLLIFIFNYK